MQSTPLSSASSKPPLAPLQTTPGGERATTKLSSIASSNFKGSVESFAGGANSNNQVDEEGIIIKCVPGQSSFCPNVCVSFVFIVESGVPRLKREIEHTIKKINQKNKGEIRKRKKEIDQGSCSWLINLQIL
jgi:hypothetical protein